ncbi:MAG: OB-fold nucleic acid binding domain-containing protein [Candidatus Thermoplasmatota archaeon]|nr:OB-fold nucleic acid binding domain-containing protein [Candidatus Thermoplasmatota archaeon]
MRSVRDSFEDVKDLVTYDEFRERMSDTVSKFGGLLTEDVAALLVLEELGRYEVTYDSISDIQPDQTVRVRGEVLRVSPVREFRKRERLGRVANVTISDGSAECRLVLWDEDTELVSNGALKTGGNLRVINGYARMTDFGLEISKGRFGAVVVE